MTDGEIIARIRRERRYVRRLRRVPGASDYWISDDGRVWSMKSGAPTELKRYPTKHTGYLRLSVVQDDGTRRTVDVHRLVCETYHGPPPFEDAVVRHLNGIKLDVRAENLAWGTTMENYVDKFRHAVKTLLRASPQGGNDVSLYTPQGGRGYLNQTPEEFFGPLLKEYGLICPHCGEPFEVDWS